MKKKTVRSRVRVDAKKFAAYAVAGAAAFVGSDTVDADITYNSHNFLLEDTTGPGEVSFDVQFGDASSFNLDFYHGVANDPARGFAKAGGEIFATSLAGVSIAGFAVGTNNYISNVASNAVLSSLTSWIGGNASGYMAAGNGFGNSQFLNSGEGFLGVRFDNGSGFAYGWVRVIMNGADLNSYTVVDGAFADANENINVGQTTAVPEPGSLACLALGAIGLASWRRKRNQV